MQRKRHLFKYVLANIAVAALVSLLLAQFVIAAYVIEGQSMTPHFQPGERLLIRKLMIDTGNLKRFDVVVLKKPDNPGITVIKRIIAMPGEIVEIKEGIVYIDGKLLKQPFKTSNDAHPQIEPDIAPTHIPPDHYFVIGDNHQNSVDSRIFGEVPIKNITGKAILRYWPLVRFGKVE